MDNYYYLFSIILTPENYNDLAANKDLYEKDKKIVGPWMRTFNL